MYGMDKELAEKQAEKMKDIPEKEIVTWIEAVTGEQKLEEMSTADWLKDGLVLCALVNAIHPGSVKKVSKMKAPFKKMENITGFTDSARQLGVNEASMFATPDLYEEKNMASVLSCIYTFGGVIQTTCPDFQGPKLGAPIHATVQDKRRSRAPATQTGGLSGTMDQQSARTHQRDAAGNVDRPETVDAEGLDADLKKKMAEKFDQKAADEVCAWIEEVTGEKKGEQTMAEWLKNGQVLVKVANTIQPDSIKSVHTGNMPFKQMENISHFLSFARELGMAESSVFSTPDLFEEKNMGIVVTALYTFGGVVQAKADEIGFNGPKLGVAVNAEVVDTNRGLGLVTDQNEAMNRHMQVERPKDMNIVMNVGD